MPKNLRILLGLFLALAMLAAGCGSATPSAGSEGANDPADTAAQATENGGDAAGGGDAGGDSGLTGEVTVSGSSTVEPISARNAEKFAQDNPNVAISVDGPGTGDGFEIFCNGESDVSDASRAIEQEEIDTCEQNGIEFVELKVAIDGLSVITSQDNDQVECLSFEDLYALLGPESTGFQNWSDAQDLANELGSDTQMPDAPLSVTAPGEESGTFDSFAEIVLEGLAEERGQDPAPRPDYQASPNDNVIVEGISGSPTSLGWVGYAFVQANPEPVKALPVDGGDGCVEPNPETIASGEFPISRPLFIYINKANAEEKPELGAFVDFYLSDEGFKSVSEVGYIDLEDSEISKTQDVWESMESGTREGGE
ncbi:MAG: phosphate ABC transporter substrate-binding protein PstS family protein [Egibacteraceae bacterium]